MWFSGFLSFLFLSFFCSLTCHIFLLCLLQAQYVFIHKAMVEVCETMSTFKASNRFAEFHAIYINGEFSFNATHAYIVVLSDVIVSYTCTCGCMHHLSIEFVYLWY